MCWHSKSIEVCIHPLWQANQILIASFENGVFVFVIPRLPNGKHRLLQEWAATIGAAKALFIFLSARFLNACFTGVRYDGVILHNLYLGHATSLQFVKSPTNLSGFFP
jgi:hypothetical protein